MTRVQTGCVMQAVQHCCLPNGLVQAIQHCCLPNGVPQAVRVSPLIVRLCSTVACRTECHRLFASVPSLSGCSALLLVFASTPDAPLRGCHRTLSNKPSLELVSIPGMLPLLLTGCSTLFPRPGSVLSLSPCASTPTTSEYHRRAWR